MSIKMKNSLQQLFLANCNLQKNGWSDVIYIDSLIKLDSGFKSNNGCQWARKGSSLDNTYNLKRFHANELGGKGNRVVAVQLQGFRAVKEDHAIPQSVKQALKNSTCSILDVITSDMEIDHKNGKYSQNNNGLENFQRMTKSVNDAKREHCKRCNATGIRYDATRLGYNVPYIFGEANSTFCKGCYWYDPKEFNKQISLNFSKKEEIG